MSLTTCLKKADNFLPASDKSAILEAAREYRQQGLSPSAAASRAVTDQLAQVQAELDAAAKVVVNGLDIQMSLARPLEQNSTTYMPSGDRSRLSYKLYDEARQTPEGIRLAAAAQEAYAQNGKRWDKVQSEAVRLMNDTLGDKARSAFASIDEATIARIAMIQYGDEARASIPETGARQAEQASRQYERQYVESRLPAGSPFVEAANQRTKFEDTPQFKSWFGDSRVVDKEGRPLVAFHGTIHDFGEFQVGRNRIDKFRSGPGINGNYSGEIGSWFAAPSLYGANYDAGNAEGTADVFNGSMRDETPQGANTMPVFLKIEKPMEFEGFEHFQDYRDDFKSLADLKSSIIADGHDGIVIRNSETDGNQDRDDWVVFYPNQIKSAIGNNGDFDANSNNITRSPARPEFYSQLQRAIEGVPDRLSTMAAPQWKLWLDANAGKLGVKKDEIEFSGVKDFLDMRGKDKVTRDEIAGYLGENGVKVNEVVLGGSAYDRFNQSMSDKYGDEWDSDLGKLTKEERQFYRDVDTNPPGATKYASYTVPGGENYREILITLPTIEENGKVTVRQVGEKWYLFRGEVQLDTPFGKKQYADDALQDELDGYKQFKSKDAYKSSHFDQENILAHLRVDDRTDSDGRKVLFLQEVQSDWGQDGKKKGFATNPAKTVQKNGFWGVQFNGDFVAEISEERARESAMSLNIVHDTKTPAGPFVGKTEAWVGLAIKHAIMHAASNGYDKVAFINGEQAAGLYDLSQQLDTVLYDPSMGTVIGRKDGGNAISKTVKNSSEIADVVGKEIAERLLASPKNDYGMHELSGVDLVVGGEGMKTFYDTLVPQVANDVLKKLGGGKIGSVYFGKERTTITSTGEVRVVDEKGELWNTLRDADAAQKYIESMKGKLDLRMEEVDVQYKMLSPQPGFDITPAMREKMAGGVPLFSRSRDWGDFPDVVISSRLGEASKHPDYAAAKAGDTASAMRLVGAVLTPNSVVQLKALINGRAATLVPVHAEEASGRNKIPNATAVILGDRLDLPTEDGIAQSSKVSRTGSDGLQRLARQPGFVGAVKTGENYILVDDTLTQGGTFAQLKEYIEKSGGKVLGAFALTGKQYSAKIKPNVDTIAQLRKDYGAIEPWWKSEFGHGFDGLTESEARYISKSNLSPDALRDRVAAARSEGLDPADAGNTGIAADGADQLKAGDSATRSTPRNQTDTPAFKAFFGDSVVTDTGKAGGKPMVVYHATDEDFTVFRTGEYGAHFGDLSAANARADELGRDDSHIVPVYLAMKNPLRLEDAEGGDWAPNENDDGVMGQLIKLGLMKKSEVETMGLGKVLWRAGYDGVIYDNAYEGSGGFSYIAFKPEQIKSAIGNNGNFDGTKGDITQSTPRNGDGVWQLPEASKFDDFVYKMQNKMIDTKRVIEAMGPIDDERNVYLQEELFHGRAAKQTTDFGNDELKPLMEKMAAKKVTIAGLEEYLHAKHAREANQVIAQRNPDSPDLQDGGSGMSNAAAAAYLSALPTAEKAELAELAGDVRQILDKTRQLYADYGLEAQGKVDSWAGMFENYIPLQREDKDGNGSGMGMGQGFSVKGKEVKGRTGSKRKVVDIIGNIAMQRERLIVRGEKNRVAVALVGLATANPNKDFWSVGSPPADRVYDPKTNTVVERVDPMFKSRDNVLVAKVRQEDGSVVEQAVVFNEDQPRAVRMAVALKNLDAGNLEGLLGVSAKITRYFAAINTQYNPVFGVVNLIRDVQGAMVNLGGTPLAKSRTRIAKDTLSAIRGIYSDMRSGNKASKWSDLWEQFQNEGGQTGYRELFRTGEDRANELKKALNPDGWMDSPMGKLFTANGALRAPMSVATKGSDWLFGWLSDYNEAMENGVRLAAFKAGLDQGMSAQQAASLAKNLTVNFNRKGQVGQQAGAVYAFFNASFQGSARLAQALFDMDGGDIRTLRLTKTGKTVVTGGLILGSMQALALAAAGFDDEDPPEFLRERSLIIPTGGKTYVTIPMPLGLHVIPGFGRHATEFVLSGFKDPAKRVISMTGMLVDAFNPIGSAGWSMQTLAPTALDPLVALTENRDWTGKPIARTSSNPATPGHALRKDTASEFSKFMSEAINTMSGGSEYVAGSLSPKPDQIDYLLAQVGGGVWRELSKVEQTTLGTIRGEAVPTFKIPLVGRFIGNAGSQASEGTAFYANVQKANAIETEIKGMKKDGKNTEAQALMKSKPEGYLIAQANAAERQIQALRREKRVMLDKGVDREEIKAMEVKITAVMARLNRAADQLREKQSAQ